MAPRLISGLAATLAVLTSATGCRRPDARGTAASSASQPQPSAAPQASGVASPDAERLTITRFLGQGCALDQANQAWCWSPPTSALLSDEGNAVPARIPELDGASAFQKTAYFSYILRGGNLYVWGKEKHSYLGDVSKPTLMPAPTDVLGLATSGWFASALRTNAEVWEWSDTSFSEEPGEAGVMDNRRPSLLGTNVRSLAPPSNDFFIGSDGKIYQRIFQGDEVRRKQVTVLKDPLSVTPCRVTCAILNPEHVECWQESKPSETFALKLPSAVASLKCGGAVDILAVLADGSVWAFKRSFSGDKLSRIPTLDGVADLDSCSGTLNCPYCVKLKDGSVSCWAQSYSRQLGSGSWPTDPQFTPLLKGRDATTTRSR